MRSICCLAAALLLLVLAGCGAPAATKGAPGAGNTVSQVLEQGAAGAAPSASAAPAPGAASAAAPAGDVDVDLTKMNATMVYAQVSQIVYNPESYLGKTIRMGGQSWSMTDEITDTTYYSVIIADATACCATGIEYLLAEGGEYPPNEEEVTVVGTFELYDENGMLYCRLANARREA